MNVNTSVLVGPIVYPFLALDTLRRAREIRILSISESRSADSYIARVGQDVKKRRADHWLSRPRICLEGCNKKESNMVNR